MRLAQRIGINRVAKDLTPSLGDYLDRLRRPTSTRGRRMSSDSDAASSRQHSRVVIAAHCGGPSAHERLERARAELQAFDAEPVAIFSQGIVAA